MGEGGALGSECLQHELWEAGCPRDVVGACLLDDGTGKRVDRMPNNGGELLTSVQVVTPGWPRSAPTVHATDRDRSDTPNSVPGYIMRCAHVPPQAAATIASLTRERDVLQQRVGELAARLAEVAGREGAARGAAALRGSCWRKTAVAAEARRVQGGGMGRLRGIGGGGRRKGGGGGVLHGIRRNESLEEGGEGFCGASALGVVLPAVLR